MLYDVPPHTHTDLSALVLAHGVAGHGRSLFRALFTPSTGDTAQAAVNFSGLDPFWALPAITPVSKVRLLVCVYV